MPGTLLTAKVIVLVMNENLRNDPSKWLQVGINEEQKTVCMGEMLVPDSQVSDPVATSPIGWGLEHDVFQDDFPTAPLCVLGA